MLLPNRFQLEPTIILVDGDAVDTPRRAFVRGIGTLAIFVVSLLPAMAQGAAGTAQNVCPAAALVQTSNGPRCGYVVQAVPVNWTRSGFGLLDTPTYVIAKGFEQIPGLGYFVGAAFAAEQNRHHSLLMKAPPGYESYVLAGQRDHVWSETGAAGWHFARTDERLAAYTFRLKKKGPFKGRSWFHADLVMVWRHPLQTDDASQVQAIIKQVIAAQDRSRQEAAAAERAKRTPLPSIRPRREIV